MIDIFDFWMTTTIYHSLYCSESHRRPRDIDSIPQAGARVAPGSSAFLLGSPSWFDSWRLCTRPGKRLHSYGQWPIEIDGLHWFTYFSNGDFL